MFVADGFLLFLILTVNCESNVKNRKDIHYAWRAFLFYPLSRSLPTPHSPLENFMHLIINHFCFCFFFLLFFPRPLLPHDSSLLPLTWFFFQLKNHVAKTSPSPSQPRSSSAVCIFNEATWLYRSANLLLFRPPLVCFLDSICKRVNWRPTLFCFYFLFSFLPHHQSVSAFLPLLHSQHLEVTCRHVYLVRL